jgi:hypothetical protein
MEVTDIQRVLARYLLVAHGFSVLKKTSVDEFDPSAWNLNSNCPDRRDETGISVYRVLCLFTPQKRRTSKKEAMMDKATLLKNIQDEHEHWEMLLNQLPHRHMIQPGVAGHWTVKDLLAHVTVFELWTADQLAAVLRGETRMYQPSYVPPGAEQWTLEQQNAAIYATYRDRPLSEVLSQAREVQQQLLSRLAALPDEVITQAERFEWTGGEPLWEALASRTYRHRQVHRPDLEAWVQRARESLLDNEHTCSV